MKPEELHLQNKLTRLNNVLKREKDPKNQKVLLRRIKLIQKELQGTSTNGSTTMEKKPEPKPEIKSMEKKAPTKTTKKKTIKKKTGGKKKGK